jgi:hypothetical protein
MRTMVCVSRLSYLRVALRADPFLCHVAEERAFLLDEVLKPRIGSFEGNTTLEWRDLEEDDATGSQSGDVLFQFVVEGAKTDGPTFQRFYEAILRCLYERKQGADSSNVTPAQLVKMFGT